jgi:hypothetical protein
MTAKNVEGEEERYYLWFAGKTPRFFNMVYRIFARRNQISFFELQKKWREFSCSPKMTTALRIQPQPTKNMPRAIRLWAVLSNSFPFRTKFFPPKKIKKIRTKAAHKTAGMFQIGMFKFLSILLWLSSHIQDSLLVGYYTIHKDPVIGIRVNNIW